MKKLITKEQKEEIVTLAETGHWGALSAFGSERWNNGYNYGYLTCGLSCLVVAGICFAYDWLRTRD